MQDYNFVGSTDSLSFTHTNLQPSGMQISYKVAAQNDVGEGVQTESIEVIVAVLPDKPEPPVLVSADRTQISIDW